MGEKLRPYHMLGGVVYMELTPSRSRTIEDPADELNRLAEAVRVLGEEVREWRSYDEEIANGEACELVVRVFAPEADRTALHRFTQRQLGVMEARERTVQNPTARGAVEATP